MGSFFNPTKSALRTLDNMQSLQGLEGRRDGEQVFVRGFYFTDDGGEGFFVWEATGNKLNHDGGKVIDPTNDANLLVWDSAAQNTWFTAQSGDGVWVRVSDSDTASIAWYGARADGGSDNVRSINKCLQANQKILFPYHSTGGHYHTSVLTIDADKEIYGESFDNGAVTVLSDFDNDKGGVVFLNGGKIASNGFNLYIENMAFKVTNDGLFDVGANNIKLVNCAILGNGGYGNAQRVENVIMLDCFIGFAIIGIGSLKNSKIVNCEFLKCVAAVVQPDTSENVKFIDCEFLESTGEAVDVSGIVSSSRLISFRGCLFKDNQKCGIRIRGDAGASLSGCTFDENGRGLSGWASTHVLLDNVSHDANFSIVDCNTRGGITWYSLVSQIATGECYVGTMVGFDMCGQSVAPMLEGAGSALIIERQVANCGIAVIGERVFDATYTYANPATIDCNMSLAADNMRKFYDVDVLTRVNGSATSYLARYLVAVEKEGGGFPTITVLTVAKLGNPTVTFSINAGVDGVNIHLDPLGVTLNSRIIVYAK